MVFVKWNKGAVEIQWASDGFNQYARYDISPTDGNSAKIRINGGILTIAPVGGDHAIATVSFVAAPGN